MLSTREAALAAVQQRGWALSFASGALRADVEVVLAAVRQEARALQFASEALRADREVLLAAVRQDGCALEFASEALRADAEVALAAVRQDGDALRLASEALRADPFLARAAREAIALAQLPRLCRFLLARHRQQRAARVAAQADVWLIRHGQDGFARACKRQRAA